MKKQTKRILSLLLAMTMALGLAACGKSEPDPEGGSVPEGGRPTVTVGVRTVSSVTTYEDNKLTKYLEDKLNINIDFVNFSSTSSEGITQLNTMIAGGDRLPDMLWGLGLSWDQYNSYGDQGYLMDLAPYFDDPDWELAKEYTWHERLLEGYGQDAYNTAMYGRRDAAGHMYFFPGYGQSESDMIRAHMFINQTWLDKLGLEMPTTWDELVGVLRAFRTQDPNGNGIADEIPMLGAKYGYSDTVSWVLGNFDCFVNDKKLFNVDEDGNIYLPHTTDEYRQGVRVVRDLVSEGLLSPMTWTIASTSELPALWTPANGTAVVGVMAGHTSLRVTQDSPVLREYVPLPPLEDSYVSLSLPAGSNIVHITTDCEQVDAALRLCMEVTNPDTYRRFRYGEEGVDWVETIDYETQIPMVKVINSDAYGGQTDSTWAMAGPYMCGGDPRVNTTTGEPPKAVEDMDWNEYRKYITEEMVDVNMEHARQYNPERLFNTVIYNEQELEENGTSLENITAYVSECRAKFAVGQMDIDSDAEWNQYLSTIESLGSETLLKNTQAAYDRQENR